MTWDKKPRSARYGSAHAKARKAAAARHQPTDPCARCGQSLGLMGPHLHYDHAEDGVSYLGFSCASCNRRAGARKGSRIAHAHRRVRHLRW
jgi:hypothetical protein